MDAENSRMRISILYTLRRREQADKRVQVKYSKIPKCHLSVTRFLQAYVVYNQLVITSSHTARHTFVAN
jgi:hypothetical protein